MKVREPKANVYDLHLISCTGLAVLFFILSLAGNLTYGGGVSFSSRCANLRESTLIRTDPISLHLERLLINKFTMAYWILRDNRRRRIDICAISNVS